MRSLSAAKGGVLRCGIPEEDKGGCGLVFRPASAFCLSRLGVSGGGLSGTSEKNRGFQLVRGGLVTSAGRRDVE